MTISNRRITTIRTITLKINSSQNKDKCNMYNPKYNRKTLDRTTLNEKASFSLSLCFFGLPPYEK